MEKNETLRDHFSRISLEIGARTGMCEADSDCTHSLEMVVEPPATVELGLCSDAIHDVSYDFLFMRWS